MIRSSSKVTLNQKCSKIFPYDVKKSNKVNTAKSTSAGSEYSETKEKHDVADSKYQTLDLKTMSKDLFERNSKESLAALGEWDSDFIADNHDVASDEIKDAEECSSIRCDPPEENKVCIKQFSAKINSSLPIPEPLYKKEEDLLVLKEKLSEQLPSHENTCVCSSESNSIPRIISNLELDCLEQGNSYTERQIYEMQLVQLQEQLVEVMIQDQEKSKKLKFLENVHIDVLLKELEQEKQKNSELVENLLFLRSKSNCTLQRKNASRRRRKTIDVDVNTTKQGESKESEIVTEDEGSTFLFEEDHYATEINAGTQKSTDESSFSVCTRIVIGMVEERLWDFVNDDREPTAKERSEGNALSVKVLKENITRCTNRIKPMINGVQAMIDIITWASPLTSILTFVVFMIAARHGYLFSVLLFIVICQLSINYIHSSGIATKFCLAAEEKQKDSPSDDKTLSNKFQLVLQVAQKVQNLSGKIADSMEKINNLLTWQHPVTGKLFIIICVLFVSSLLMDGRMMFMYAALVAGVKLLIIKPIYIKYPKVQKRYDRLLRMWNELPTDAQVEARCRYESDIHTTTPKPSSLTKSWTYFCEKMKIPLSEAPVQGWEEGQSCTLLTKDKVLAKAKSGKMYLTQSYLCFERCPFESPKNFTIKLEDISSISKRAALFLPGTGSSIEIKVKESSKLYLFGGMLKRDELLESLFNAGTALRLPWAFEG